MTDLVRTVPSGSVGLDLVLGGGPRLLRRFTERSPAESATVLVRGGPGSGKSVLATDFALRMAKAVGGDVLYACVEILPREVLAQRKGFDREGAPKAVDLARKDARKESGDGPTLVVGMREMEMSPTDDGVVPDLGQMILDLMRVADARGFDPRVVVVDSLSDGYKLGRSTPRKTVDGICKLAVELGWVLVLVEEAVDEQPSPWSFAVDTVLSLEVTAAGRRELGVTKHRFGPSQPGPHRLLIEPEGVRVIPCFAAYRNAVRDLPGLPGPTANRSVRVPLLGQVPNWKQFNVQDGKGYVVVLDAPAVITDLPPVPAWEGTVDPGPRVTFELSESNERLSGQDRNEVSFPTLHQMIDGEEWLEAALSCLVLRSRPLSVVQIGRTDSIRVYEERYTLRKAISLLAAILARRGLLVVVYGSNVREEVIHAEIVNQVWRVDPSGSRLDVERLVT